MMIAPLIPLWMVIIVSILLVAGIAVMAIRATPAMRRRWWSRWTAVLLLIVILLRPQIYTGEHQPMVRNLDVYFVIDTTQSVAAEDFDGDKTRLVGIQQDVASILGELSGARFSLVTFANDTRLDLPLITDTSAVKSAVNTLEPVSYIYATGSDISMPAKFMQERLAADQKTYPDRQRIVYYFGDGEQTGDGKELTSFDGLKQYVSNGAVLGYGTTTGGRMQETSYHSSRTESTIRYIQDYRGGTYAEDALSKIDETNLTTIAEQIGVPYIHRTNNDSIETVISSIDAAASIRVGDKGGVPTYFDLYWIAALAMWLLLMRDYARQLTDWMTWRRQRSGGAR